MSLPKLWSSRCGAGMRGAIMRGGPSAATGRPFGPFGTVGPVELRRPRALLVPEWRFSEPDGGREVSAGAASCSGPSGSSALGVAVSYSSILMTL